MSSISPSPGKSQPLPSVHVSSTHSLVNPAAFEVILRADGPSDAFPERKVRIVPGTPLVIGRTSKNLDKGLLAGPDNAYFDSPVVSREHAFLDNGPGEDAIFITDFSTHGTMVNGQMLQRSSRHKLHNGDKLRFGTDVVRESGMQCDPTSSSRHPRLTIRQRLSLPLNTSSVLHPYRRSQKMFHFPAALRFHPIHPPPTMTWTTLIVRTSSAPTKSNTGIPARKAASRAGLSQHQEVLYILATSQMKR